MLLILGGGLIAGMMNSLAGGGSFVSLPVLIAAGVPPLQANASSTVALFPGGVLSAWIYREELGPVGAVRLRPLVLTTFAGGMCGAALLLRTPAAAFEFVLPWLLLLTTAMLSFGARIGVALAHHRRVGPWSIFLTHFCLGGYGGYFGGALGIMMMAAWNLLDTRAAGSPHAPRTLLVSSANVAAVVIFSAAHAVCWRQTLVMLVGAMAGGYIGARIGRRAPPRLVRAGTILLAACITAMFFARAYS